MDQPATCDHTIQTFIPAAADISDKDKLLICRGISTCTQLFALTVYFHIAGAKSGLSSLLMGVHPVWNHCYLLIPQQCIKMLNIMFTFISRASYSANGVQQRATSAHAHAGSSRTHGSTDCGWKWHPDPRHPVSATCRPGGPTNDGRILPSMYSTFPTIFHAGLTLAMFFIRASQLFGAVLFSLSVNCRDICASWDFFIFKIFGFEDRHRILLPWLFKMSVHARAEYFVHVQCTLVEIPNQACCPSTQLCLPFLHTSVLNYEVIHYE